jgi:hypothetical protein
MSTANNLLDMKPISSMPLGGCLTWGMHALFGGIALMLIATTWQSIAELPWLPLFYVVSFFPNFVLWGVGYLNRGMRLIVSADGIVTVKYPLTTKTFLLSDAAQAGISSTQMHAGHRGHVTVSSLVINDLGGKCLISLPTALFATSDVAKAVALFNRTPQV